MAKMAHFRAEFESAKNVPKGDSTNTLEFSIEKMARKAPNIFCGNLRENLRGPLVQQN